MGFHYILNPLHNKTLYHSSLGPVQYKVDFLVIVFYFSNCCVSVVISALTPSSVTLR